MTEGGFDAKRARFTRLSEGESTLGRRARDGFGNDSVGGEKTHQKICTKGIAFRTGEHTMIPTFKGRVRRRPVLIRE